MWFRPNVEKMEMKVDVKGLIKALRNKDLKIVGAATGALIRIGEPAVEPLTQILKDEDPRLRIIAATALGKIGNTQVIEPLADVLRHDTYFRAAEEAASALVKIGKPAVEVLTQTMENKSFIVRLLTVKALSRIKDERAVDCLIQSLSDEYWEVRKEAAESLGEMGDPRAIESLSKTLEDTRSLKKEDYILTLEHLKLIRLAVIDALVKIGVKIGNPALVLIHVIKNGPIETLGFVEEALDKISWKPQDTTERAYYLIMKKQWWLLVELGKSAVEPLIQALKHSNFRREATEILGEIGDARAIEPIIQFMPYEKGIFIDIMNRALSKITGKPAVEPLIQALKYQDLRSEAIRILGDIGDAIAVEPLSRILLDDDWKTQQDTVFALGKIRDFRSAQAIIDWLFSEYPALVIRTHQFNIPRYIDSMRNLFGEYASLILKASGIKEEIIPSPGKEDSGRYNHDLKENEEAIQELCKINTQISSNILHKISQRRDIKVTISWSCNFFNEGNLSFESQREIAINELKRRGNPPYDPAAFLSEEAWKLSVH
jgi:HEAT repeat protein